MKPDKLLFFFVSLASLNSAFANSDIATAMKQMSAALTTVAAQATIATDNASSAALCDQITAGIEAAKAQTPDSVAELSPNQQPAQQKAFVDLLTTLEGQVAQLKADFVAGNNAQAVSDMAAITATKKTGHAQFKN